MSFVNFNIWQIKQAESGDFAKGVIGFGRDVEQNLLEATSPFVFSTDLPGNFGPLKHLERLQIRSDMIMLPMCGNTHVFSLRMTLDACPADHRDDS